MALIYLFVIVYNMTWVRRDPASPPHPSTNTIQGPLPWPYVSEIFPTRIREPGVAAGVAAQWLFNFVFTLTTPYMIANSPWGTFLMWGAFNSVISLVSFLFVRETRGRTLEEINAEVFAGGPDGAVRKARTSGEAASRR